MNDENKKIVEEINQRNKTLFGDIQKCCEQFKEFCKCGQKNKVLDFLELKK